ncbi:uncharacterized protein LOC101845779 [Aplysia californica]|uniref:Uncharacterized protein LOC101845779 n=1 Tax=Aplysia californica TaxID=6500 RepID=A0ABM1A2H6_APLCA|nr:uncharacterized protein LOC101845779 [Aplysia californica]
MQANNENNQARVRHRQNATPSTSNLLYRLIMNGVHFVLRFYITCLLIAYDWAVRVIRGFTTPFEPVMKEVRKVPKKDISVEGIFYQVLRLQFLMVLYVSPFAIGAARYLSQPFFWVKDWMVDYVRYDEEARQEKDPTILKEG